MSYKLRGNKLANIIYDKFLKPEEKPSYDGPIPKKPAGLEELPPNINIKNLSDMKKKTPQEQYEHNVQMKNPFSAYTRKEKEDLKKLIEVAKEAGVLKDDGANTMNISFDDADLASQTPAGEASADGILPGSDGWVNQTGGGSGGDGSGNGSGDEALQNMSETEALEIANKWAADGGWYANVMANGTEEDKAKAKMALNVINNSKKTSADTTGGGSGGGSGSSSNDKVKQQAKQESRYKLRSIMDAYNEGLLDKETRDYLIMDVIAKFVRNLGKDIGNIAAAYTGGTIDNEREESIWSKRNEEMAKKAINAEGNRLRNEDNYDLDYQSQKLDLAKKRIQMVPAQNFQKAADEMRKAGNKTGAAIMDLIAAASTNGVDPEEYIAAAYANDPNVKELVNNSLGALSNIAGGIGDLTGMVRDFIEEFRNKNKPNPKVPTTSDPTKAAFMGTLN